MSYEHLIEMNISFINKNWKLPIQNYMYYFKNKNLIDIIQS